jgi:hypothetical protein
VALKAGTRMIEFSNFYQLIAKNHLSHWLETLPAQIAAWQRDQQHGLLKQWSNAVEFLPELTPHRLDLHSVTAESEEPLPPGQINRIETLMRNLMPWRRAVLALRREHQYRMALRLEMGSRSAAPFRPDRAHHSGRGLRQRLSHVAHDWRGRASGGRHRPDAAVPVSV